MRSKLPALLLTLGFLLVSAAPAARAEGDAKTVVITANDSLKFSVTRIEAQPGQLLHIQLKNTGTMPKDVMGHNWILLRAGTDVTAYANTALSARGEGYQPKALEGEVLEAIPLQGPRQTGEVTFAAPSVPGSYPFLCSFPGHFLAGMHGVLVVK